MIDLASAVFGSRLLAWLIGGLGLVALAAAMVQRKRLTRQSQRLAAGQEKLADGLWEVKAAAEARLRAEASTHAKSRFLATVSHEVRTPLNGVLGMAELLGATPLNAEQQAYVEAIHASGRALTTLIEEVLDLSRIEAGRLDLAAEPFDVVALVEAVVELLAPRAQEKGLEIASLVGPDVPAMLIGDGPRLRQVLINLAGNAVKFTERGGVGLKVEQQAAGGLVFTVADSGPGVPPDRRAAIFDEFEQAASGATLKQRANGSGLGLSIARRLVRLMGSEITLADRQGGGSVFTFEVYLPTAADQGAGRAALEDLAGRSALIVAASDFQAPYLAQVLGRRGARVTIVPTAEQALTALAGEACDILMVDCALGEQEINQLADAPPLGRAGQKLLMFSPFERRAFGQKMVGAFGGWLVKPVRARSLVTQLAAKPAGMAATPPAPAPRTPTSQAIAPGLRILLAEDNAINTLVMLKMLERIGAEVTHAADGAVALSAALAAMRGETKAFDTILMDISMPGLDGQEAARLLRRAEASAGATPTRIVALTAYAFEDDRQACFEAGIDDFLTKPIDFARLSALLQPAAETAAAAPGC